MRQATVIAFVTLTCACVATSCRPSPVVDGKDIRTCTAGGCPQGLRCIDGRCLTNSRPQLDPLPARTVAVDALVDITVSARDRDDDPLTITWTQVDNEAPSLISGSSEGVTLSVRPTTVGAYLFEVVASDGFEISAPESVTLTVINTPPTVRADAPAIIIDLSRDPAIRVDSEADDTEEHTVSVVWTQLSGPTALFDDMNATVLTGSALAPGIIVLEATPTDSNAAGQVLDTGTPERFTVVIQPKTNVLYVSDAPNAGVGASGPCGSWDAPCPTVADTIAAHPSPPLIMVAANAGPAPYSECLTLAEPVDISGGYDPKTWEHDPERLRALTRFVCPHDPAKTAAPAHTLSGDACLQNLTLASQAVPFEGQAATVIVDNASPTLVDVDVEVSACGERCAATGVSSNGGDPTLAGVNVRAEQRGFDIVQSFTGVRVLGGTPLIVGDDGQPDYPIDACDGSRERGSGRGSVALNAPVAENAWGALVMRSAATVDGIHVSGGLGPVLIGVQISGAGLDDTPTTVMNTTVDLQSFGTRAIAGILAFPCAENEPPCCFAGECGDFPQVISEPLLYAERNQVAIRGATSSAQAPCGAQGVGTVSARRPQVISGNTIQLTADFTFAIGAFDYSMAGVAPLGEQGDRIEDNVIWVDGGALDPLCLFGGSGQAIEQDSGVIGLLAAGDELSVDRNSIVVGPHDDSSAGLVLTGIDGQPHLGPYTARIHDNAIRVAVPPLAQGAPHSARESFGAILTRVASASAATSIFARNRIAMGTEAESSVGVLVLGDGDWAVLNNSVYGGDTPHTAGLVVYTEPSNGTTLVAHNTIHGGGLTGWTAQSRALTLASAAQGAAPGVPGVMGALTLHGNILDAGAGMGRRYVIDDWVLFDALAGTHNVGQFVGAVPGPGPLWSRVTGIGPTLLLSGAAQLVYASLESSTGPLIEFPGPRFFAPPLTGWIGPVGTEAWVVATVPGGIEDSRLSDGGDATFHPIDLPGGCAAVWSIRFEADFDPPSDLVSMLDCTADGTFQLAAMRAQPNGFVAMTPETVGNLLGAPTGPHVSNTPGASTLVFADGTTVFVYTATQMLQDATGTVGGASLNLDAQLSGVPIERAELHSLGNDADGTDTDLFVVAGGRLIVFPNPDLTGLTTIADPLVFEPEACSSSTVVDLDVGTLEVAELGFNELLVLCSNGNVEVFTRVGASLNLAATAKLEGTARDVLISNYCPSAVCTAGAIDDANRIHPLEVVDTGGTLTISASSPIGFVANVTARRDGQLLANEETFALTRFGAGVTLAPPTTPCTLDDPVDLKLALIEPGGPCADAGSVLGNQTPEIEAELAIDIDGEPRSTTPDIGADELPP